VADRVQKCHTAGTGRYTLQEAVEQLAAVAVELARSRIRNWMPWASAISRRVCAQAADVFLALEQQFGWPRSVLTCQVLGQAKLETPAMLSISGTNSRLASSSSISWRNGRRQVGEAVGPGDFVAFVIDQGNALVGGGDRKGADRNDAFMANSVFGQKDQPTVGVALQVEIAFVMAYSAWALGRSGERGSDGSVSTLRAWA
jgi:hypothetical protein